MNVQARRGGNNVATAGFTLAEVLITLGIIGIIAAITLPVLIQNYQKHVTVNCLKKEYSVISNALVTSQEENGDMTTWGVPGYVSDGYESLIPFFKNYIIKYLNVADDCGLECKKQKEILRYRLNGKDYTNWNSPWLYVAYLKDGSIIALQADNDSVAYGLIRIYIDINGDKGPNVFGKDVFTIRLDTINSAIRLSGVDAIKRLKNRDYALGNCRECCSKTAGNYSGDFCSGLIQYDGWKISKDYPW